MFRSCPCVCFGLEGLIVHPSAEERVEVLTPAADTIRGMRRFDSILHQRSCSELLNLCYRDMRNACHLIESTRIAFAGCIECVAFE